MNYRYLVLFPYNTQIDEDSWVSQKKFKNIIKIELLNE